MTDLAALIKKIENNVLHYQVQLNREEGALMLARTLYAAQQAEQQSVVTAEEAEIPGGDEPDEADQQV